MGVVKLNLRSLCFYMYLIHKSYEIAIFVANVFTSSYLLFNFMMFDVLKCVYVVISISLFLCGFYIAFSFKKILPQPKISYKVLTFLTQEGVPFTFLFT